jgi:predicted nucleotide-binding protein
MSVVAIAIAKLAGIRRALVSVASENVSRNKSGGDVVFRDNFGPTIVGHYFDQARDQLEMLKKSLPGLYGDFQRLPRDPDVKMMPIEGMDRENNYSRSQIEQLIRDIDQIFEIRANSELSQPAEEQVHRRVFISHGRSNDWREVQAYIEKDIRLASLELAQEASLGRTVVEKLIDAASRCDSAVIVMTGDDMTQDGEIRVRQNVMHEVGFFQGRYGRNFVVLLHEEGIEVPSNLGGIVYVPYPKGSVSAALSVLRRELESIYDHHR